MISPLTHDFSIYTGHYKNYTPEELVDVVAQILALVPPWTRVYRIQRDIPMPLVTSGTAALFLAHPVNIPT